MATTYSDQIRSGLTRIKDAVSIGVYADPAVASCLEDMASGLGDCMCAFERRIQELEREVRRR